MCENEAIPRCAFPNVRALAVALHSELRGDGVELVPRPHNRFDPFNSTCWLVPSNEWPAYSRGKVVMIPDDDTESIGLNLEKGLGQEAGEARVRTATPDWQWYSAMGDLQDYIEDVANRVVTGSGLPLRIRLGVIIIGTGASRSDPYTAPSSDMIQWLYDEDGLRTHPDIPAKQELGVIDPLVHMSTLPGLLRCIRRLSESDVSKWYWFDLFFTTTLRFSEKRDSAEWDASGIANALVYPWLSWVK
jgi:hypothetical protein